MKNPTTFRYPKWEKFMDDCVTDIFSNGGKIVDIGGGLRIDGSKGNRVDKERVAKYGPLLKSADVDYKVTDYTDQYHPDYVEDIHNLSFADNSIDGLFCIATLEHVYDPKKAAEEIVRVLKPGGRAFIYAPFIYRYHAHEKDYKDYFRFTKDGWEYLFRECSELTICPVRGLFESLLRFTPLHTVKIFVWITRLMDNSSKRMRKISEVQASGYNLFLIK